VGEFHGDFAMREGEVEGVQANNRLDNLRNCICLWEVAMR
jgi:hypothetical protein